MKKQDYHSWMDGIETPLEMKQHILSKIQQPTHYKRYPYVMAAGFICIIMALFINMVLPSNAPSPFVIEVQAREPINYSSDEHIQIVIQNSQTVNDDGTQHGFYTQRWSSDETISYQVLLTLPIIIQGENIKTISYQVDNNTLIPRYALDDIIKNDDESTISNIQEHVVMDNEERFRFQSHKTYSEMSKQGKLAFEKYIEKYREQILQDDWWADIIKHNTNIQDVFYDDAYTDMLLFTIRTIAYGQDATNDTLLRKLRLDEYQYFTWGKKDDTKHYTLDYSKQSTKEESLQLSIVSSNNDVIDQLTAQTIKMVVTFNDNTQETKTISFQNIDTTTNEYTLIID